MRTESDKLAQAHPRLRGEHQLVNGFLQAFHGSSPLTRGAPVTGGILQVLNRLIPAYAGSTRCSCCFLRVEWAHPRLRGEHSYFSWMVGVIFGSSPLTRGALSSRSLTRG